MNPTNNPLNIGSLEDSRVRLRLMSADDLDVLFGFAEKEPDLWRYSLLSAAGRAGMQAYVERALKAYAEGKEYPFVVQDLRTASIIGSTRFYDLDIHNQTCSLGYTWYSKAYQGSGINAHCKYLMLRYAFEHLNMHRVEFRADANNQRSIAAMRAIGCREEGILREHHLLADGSRRSSIVLSIIQTEWYEQVKPLLQSKIQTGIEP